MLLALPAPATSNPRPIDPQRPDLQGLRPGAQGGTAIGLVPDGVDSVAGADGTRAPVRDNVFGLPTTRLNPEEITWIDAAGEVVKRP